MSCRDWTIRSISSALKAAGWFAPEARESMPSPPSAGAPWSPRSVVGSQAMDELGVSRPVHADI